MNKKIILICLLMWGLSAVCNAENRFVWVVSGKTGDYYLDTQTIKESADGTIVDCWIKNVYSQMYVAEAIQLFDLPAKAASSLTHLQINFATNKAKEIQFIVYDGNGGIILDSGLEKNEWYDIPHNTNLAHYEKPIKDYLEANKISIPIL